MRLLCMAAVAALTASWVEPALGADFPYVYNITCADAQNPGKDSGGKGNDAVLKGDVKWVKDGDEGAIEFGGKDGVLEITVDAPQSNFTMAIWVKTTSPEAGISSVVGEKDGYDRTFFLQGGKVGFNVYRGLPWNSGSQVADGQWHHIALVVETNVGQTAYIDGIEIATCGSDRSDFNWDKKVLIGHSNEAGQKYFKGTLKKAVCIAQPLHTDEIVKLYGREPKKIEVQEAQ